MTETAKTIATCQFHSQDVSLCRRECEGTFCVFHIPFDNFSRDDSRFESELQILIESRDGNWNGFIFPPKFEFPSSLEKRIDFSVTAKFSTFGAFKVDGIRFEQGIDFSGSKFTSDVKILNCTVMGGGLSLEQCMFEKEAELYLGNGTKGLNANGAKFLDTFKLRGWVNGPANFNNCIFESDAKFRYLRNISLTVSGVEANGNPKADALQLISSRLKDAYLSARARVFNLYKKSLPRTDSSEEISKLFYGDVQFDTAIFKSPKSVIFDGVDLRRAMFFGTDLRDVKFFGVDWFQKTLGRKGLYDEVWLNETNDRNFELKRLPGLEYSYRYIRTSLEAVKDYSGASDFYIGEMDCARRQYGLFARSLFSVLAVYNHLCRYGTNPWRGLAWFLAFVVVHACLSTTASHGFMVTYQFIQSKVILEPFNLDSLLQVGAKALNRVLYAIQIMTLQKELLYDGDEPLTKRINVVFAILGPILVALTAFSLRGKIRRH